MKIDINLNQNPKAVSKLYAKADMKAQMERFIKNNYMDIKAQS